MSSSQSPKRVARRLAEALVAGPWGREDLVERGAMALGRKRRWLGPLVDRMLAHVGTDLRPTSARLGVLILNDPGFVRAFGRGAIAIPSQTLGIATRPAVMWPGRGAPSAWGVPAITTRAELAAFLRLSLPHLEWLADPHSRERRSPRPSGLYAYRWAARRSGSARLIEAPSPRLRSAQREILRGILDRMEPHHAAHAFREGRSILTYAEPHVGRRVVLKLDLMDFFPTISRARVTAIFLTAGYPEPVARWLAALCTNSVPSRVWDAVDAPPNTPQIARGRRLLQQAHLPQGAPSSPAIANLAAYRLDLRLSGLADSAGATYTRYADDLAFSGGRDFERGVDRFHVHACAIAIEEGFPVHTRKTRMMRQGVRQRVAGVVVNQRTNVTRADFDLLKAILHNCARTGPADQNRSGHPDFRSHLLGRIAHASLLNPERGRKLREVFDRIAW